MPLAHSRIRPRPPAVWLALAGVETGVFAGVASLAYHLLDSAINGVGPWRYPNLFSAALHPDAAWNADFSMATLAGLALHLVVAGIAGLTAAPLLAALLNREIFCRLAALAYGIAWYYLTFRFVWPEWNPELVLQQPFPGVVFGHAILGISLGLYPRFLRLLRAPHPLPESPFL